LPLVGPAQSVIAGAAAVSGALIAGGGWREPRVWAMGLAGALLCGAGHAFAAFFAEAVAARHSPDWGRAEPDRLPWRLGWALLLCGCALPAAAGREAAMLALAAALAWVLLATVTRPLWGIGFANAGAAHALTLIAGMAAGPYGAERFWPLALPLTAYVMGWEVLRCARQPGAPRTTAVVALGHLAGAVALLLYQGVAGYFLWPQALPFLILLLAAAFPRFVRAVMLVGLSPVAEAVRFGLLGQGLLLAVMVAGHAELFGALLITALASGAYWIQQRYPVPLVLAPR
jgi:hypothetical protein